MAVFFFASECAKLQMAQAEKINREKVSMEMTKRKNNNSRRGVFAVAIFFGALAASGQVAASQTEYIYSDDLPAIEMEFFDSDELSSTYDFSEPIINAAKYSASYWKNILNLRSGAVPWQIALTTSDGKIINAQTYSFYRNAATKTNYIAQMLQGNRTLTAFDLQSLADEKILADEVQTLLRENASANRGAISVVTIGKYLGMNRIDAKNGCGSTILFNSPAA